MVRNIRFIVRLFESGRSASQIAEIVGVSRQAISQRLRSYYSLKDVKVEVIRKRHCIVCGVEECFVEKKISVSDLKQLRLDPIVHEEDFLCPLCESLNLYKCSCGAIGYLGVQFLRKPIYEKTRKARCLDCNREYLKEWSKNNKERARQIASNFKSNLKKRRLKDGLCITCGRKNGTPKYLNCSSCRDKFKQYRTNNSNSSNHLSK